MTTSTNNHIQPPITVGITGQPGFMGTHLFNYLKLKKEEIKLVPFQDEYFRTGRDTGRLGQPL